MRILSRDSFCKSFVIFLIFVFFNFGFLFPGNLGTESLKSQRKRAIIVGATSGMGRQVAKLLATEGGYDVGIVGRRLDLLESLEKEIMEKRQDQDIRVYKKQLDITKHDEAPKLLLELIEQMGGLDLMFISISAYGDFIGSQDVKNKEINQKIISVDVVGFLTIAEIAIEIFKRQGHGHLVGISSVSRYRGDASCPVYSGAKAFVSIYLEGIRNYMAQNNIHVYVTDIVPGWVDNERVKFSQIPRTYWVTALEVAGRQIFEAIKSKKKVAYISKRWVLIKWAYYIVPDFIFNAMGGF